jgi:N-carbamoyl-L-amino-acid hydrolase
MAALGVASVAPSRPNAAPRVDEARLRRRLEELSAFGRPAGGTFANGVSRTAYSAADVDARRYVLDEMTALGLGPRVDPAGNIRGLRAGTGASVPPVLFGSHIDSVRGGGNFDGAVGSMGALEVVAALAEHGVRTLHPLEVVIWAAEESSYGSGLHGSRMAVGQVEPDEWDRVQDGEAKRDALRRIGGDPALFPHGRGQAAQEALPGGIVRSHVRSSQGRADHHQQHQGSEDRRRIPAQLAPRA